MATRLVQVSAVVLDKNGAPVAGLTKDDFEILDGGARQSIELFSEVTNLSPHRPKPLPPDTYTNAFSQRGAAPDNVSIIMFDTLNSHWTAQGYGLHQVRKFLRQIQPPEHVGVYVLTEDGLKVVHDFTQNASELLAAIHRYDEPKSAQKTNSMTPDSSTGNPELDRFLKGKDNRMNYALEASGPGAGFRRAQFVLLQVQMTTAALQVIARHCASVPGRRSLIWVTDGLPVRDLLSDSMEGFFETQGSSPGGDTQGKRNPQISQTSAKRTDAADAAAANSKLDIAQMVRLMNDSGIAVYPVSAEGLLTNDLGFAPAGTFGHPTPDNFSHSVMQELAARTGGRAFYNRNDINMGIRRALDDSRVSYLLGYYPDHNQWKGAFRKIKLKVNRPGAIVLARDGYFALPDPKPEPRERITRVARQLAASPVDATQLSLSVMLLPSVRSAAKFFEPKVSLDRRPLHFAQDDDHWRAKFELLFLQLDAANKVLDATNKTVDLDMTSAEHKDKLQEPFELPVSLTAMPQAATLCVILRDTNSGSLGSVHIPLAPFLRQPRQ